MSLNIQLLLKCMGTEHPHPLGSKINIKLITSCLSFPLVDGE